MRSDNYPADGGKPGDGGCKTPGDGTQAAAGDKKVYVRVTAAFSSDGKLTPLSLIWEDGQEYLIDRVTDVRPSPALKAGGQGDRYTIRTCGKESYLFFERSPKIADPTLGRWFVERRN